MGLFTDGFKELKKASEPLYRSPKSIQETIEILSVAENGIFEVSKNRYSKSYRFMDINYTTTSAEEQMDIFERYCKFLNSMDCTFKITINNKNKDMQELRNYILLQYRMDEFDRFRKIYNDIIEDKIREGRQGIEQERYLTITMSIKYSRRQVMFPRESAALKRNLVRVVQAGQSRNTGCMGMIPFREKECVFSGGRKPESMKGM